MRKDQVIRANFGAVIVLWLAVASLTAGLPQARALAQAGPAPQPGDVVDVAGAPFAVPVPPVRPAARQTPPEPLSTAGVTARLGWAPPLPPLLPSVRSDATATEDRGGEGADGLVVTRRVTEPPPPAAIEERDNPVDPGWTLRNRPNATNQPEPPSTVGNRVAVLDRPDIVEDRPLSTGGPPDSPAQVASSGNSGNPGSLAVPWDGDRARVLFDGADIALGRDVVALLDRIAARLSRDRDLRLTVLSYAGGAPESVGQARLLSLTRALSVRDYLTGRGIRQARIDVRGLGDSLEDGPPDRIDLMLGR